MHPQKSFARTGILTLGILPFILFSCRSGRELPVVDEVDLEQYAGTWYDIAHLPQRFQKGCKCVTAEYTPAEDHVKVVNTCVDEETDEVSQARGKAFPVEGSNNARLKVQFFWPFKGDYYIIALNEAYTMAMVGAPNRKYLWILSRTPEPDPLFFNQYMERAKELGFDTEALEFTDQSCHIKPMPGKS